MPQPTTLSRAHKLRVITQILNTVAITGWLENRFSFKCPEFSHISLRNNFSSPSSSTNNNSNNQYVTHIYVIAAHEPSCLTHDHNYLYYKLIHYGYIIILHIKGVNHVTVKWGLWNYAVSDFIATNFRGLTRCTNVSFVVGHRRTSSLFMSILWMFIMFWYGCMKCNMLYV
jgi:hypothetical protein